ncbi:MAG TPA: tetratricopeptide repeat protein [Pyrinomonadaceae bacterium]|nr:tetratricopeptide repeat protein [Pyrinomonadaceae bacterium]
MTKRLLKTVTILILLLMAGQAVVAKDAWVSVRSKNFFLIGNASEKEIRQVAERLEQFREVASHLFAQANLNSPIPTRVVVFKNDNSYRPFKPNAHTAGYFQPGPDVNYITLKTEVGDDQNPFGVIFHEYMHLLINNTSANVPTWFNEGLAEYYSTLAMSDDQKVVLGKPIPQHVYLLRDAKFLPLRTLFRVDQDSPHYHERDKQSIFYAESWALTHYLLLGDNGKRASQLGKFLQLMDANMSIEDAFKTAFQTTFEKMEDDLRNYVRNDRYPIAPGHFERKLEFNKEIATVVLSEAEVQAYLGDLLLHSYRPEAEAYIQRALTLDPDLDIANAALGMLRVREGKIDEARRSLERAVKADSKNYLIHYYYAYALSREGMTDSQLVLGYQPSTAMKIREELKKAIDLRPDYPETYNLLAFVNLVTQTELDESITLLKRVIETSPGRNDLHFILAQIYMRKQDFNTARQILERLSQGKGDQRLRQQSQSLLTQLIAREEEIAAYEARRKEFERNGPTPPGVIGPADAPFVTPDPSTLLREVLRKPNEGERQVQAKLVRVDCDNKGIVFTVQTDDGQIRLRTDKFQNVRMIAHSPDAGREITCGARKVENSVVVCYVPNEDSRASINGTVKSIEFVPQEFKLKG